MSFASVEFLFFFMPIALGLSIFVELAGVRRFTIFVFLGVSLVYYAWSSIPHLVLLLALIIVTWTCADLFLRARDRDRRFLAGTALASGLTVNLVALGVWKYGASFVSLWNVLGLPHTDPPGLLLPLGISFYVLQQIGFLLDLRLRRTSLPSLLDYAAFVTFFPQLLSGPIVTHRRMVREFEKIKTGRSLDERLDMATMGVAWVVIGLFKKVVLADSLSARIMPLIDQTTELRLASLDAWKIALSSGPVIYLDFSGYSDMAVGLGLLFGVALPYNFNAPIRTKSERGGWRRWHITFHDFVRDHVYRPLHKIWGTTRWGATAAIFVVFAVSALWHGDGLRFLFWGLLTFIGLVFMEILAKTLPQATRPWVHFGLRYAMFIAMPLIFVAPDLTTATAIVAAMADLSALTHELASISLVTSAKFVVLILLLISLSSEISTQVLLNGGRDHPERHFFGYRPPLWRPSMGWAMVLSVMFGLALLLLGQSSMFYYNRF